MTNFIPIFPLSIVVYPDELLNLHIFEPKYKQLINDSLKNKKPFGIPAVINNTIAQMGTLMQVIEITKTYPNGEMDIKTQGLQVFSILEIVKEIPEKLYNGAIVTYPKNNLKGNRTLMGNVIGSIKKLHLQLQVTKEFKKPVDTLWSYDVAHHAGLTLHQEYELLQLLQELQRQEYLKQHLQKVLSVINEMELLKQKIHLNGHFKNLSGFNV
jgi:uncharacterized protein